MAKPLLISILIPTLNAGRVLDGCLRSIINQDYPKNKIEIIVADGGSSDKTLKIAKKYKAKIHENPLITGEAGKAVALKRARGELVALFDSDNVLPSKSWLRKMIEPFIDKQVLGSEPWEFTYRKNDSLVNRYCALIGANDPYCFFVGNYDKKSVLSGNWTGVEIKSIKYKVLSIKDKNIREQREEVESEDWDYMKVLIALPDIPTIGANGTIWRAEVLRKTVGKSDYLFDIEIPYALARQKPFWFAKVKTGIVHDYCRTIDDFYRKQKRRARDFFYQEKMGDREQTYQRQLSKQLYFIFSTVTVFPLIFQSLRGYFKKPDRAWFFHPLACLITLWLYGTETIVARFKVAEMDRRQWKQ